MARRVAVIVALVALVLAATACGTYRYAGDSRTEAKVIGDRYLIRNYAHPALFEYEGMHKAHIIGREAWMLVYLYVAPGAGPIRRASTICVFVWWARYHDDDYAIGRKCS